MRYPNVKKQIEMAKTDGLKHCIGDRYWFARGLEGGTTVIVRRRADGREVSVIRLSADR